ncbi:MAG TPA: hypothetical protein VFN68_12635 [Acidimicrobiales bacterium]|nr:hypothetical protein [Acidimicrobiales bacterium]
MTAPVRGAGGGGPSGLSSPPPGSFSIFQRILRGYGPMAVLVAVLVVVALAVPSRVPKTATLTAGNTGSYSTGSSGAGAGATGASSGGATSAGGGAAPGAGANAGGAASAVSGRSGGGATPSGNGRTATTSASARVVSCKGDQVPGDPYSPPCLLFSGSNGGATAMGVTPTTINVAFRLTSDQSFQQTLAQLAGASLKDTNADTERTVLALAQYFNAHFQFYGRKLVIHFYNGQGSLSNELLGTGQAQAEADALTVKSMNAFADLSAESEPYADALSRQGVMAFGDPYMSENWHAQHAPYAWSIATDGTDVATIAANYAVNKLCGGTAAYAGGNLKGVHRKFALLAPENSWYQESVAVAQQIMASHGCPADIFTYSLDLGTMSQQASNLIAKLKAGGYTTVLCGCDPIFPVYMSGQGNQQNYLPEFVITGTALTDQDYTAQLWNQNFAAHAFGVSPNAPTVAYTQTIGYAAYKTVRSDEPAFFVNLIYAQMDQLAIGIQMAGPHLTPLTFQQGMYNYPSRQGPMGLWGFSPTQHTIPNDVREICYSPTAISPYNGKAGAYLGTSNARWTKDDIPKGPPGCPIPS